MELEKLRKGQKTIMQRLRVGYALVGLLALALVIFGGGLLAKNALPVFMLGLGIVVGAVGGFWGALYVLTHIGMDEEIKRLLKSADQEQPK